MPKGNSEKGREREREKMSEIKMISSCGECGEKMISCVNENETQVCNQMRYETR